jgi:hypothetical protein
VDISSTPVSDDAGAVPASNGSAVISTDDLLGGTSDDTTTVTPDPVTDSTAPTGQIGDPLAGLGDDSTNATVNTAAPGENDDIVPNDTITTNDWSKVGEIKPDEPPAQEPVTPILPEDPEPEPEITPEIAPEPAPEVPFASELKYKLPGIDDPEKIAFIKTYTQEFDDALKRATDAAENILRAIDRAVHEHSPDITVPDEAMEFLAKKPTDGKVEKFEDARGVVQEVLDRAADAKGQSAKAAEEAARIYDEVQAFKRETEGKIAELMADPSGQLSQPQPPQIV